MFLYFFARFVSQTPLTRVREHCSQLLLGSSAKLPSREFVSIVLSSCSVRQPNSPHESSWALFSALARFVSQTPLTRVREHCSQLLLGSSAKLPSREFVSIVLSSCSVRQPNSPHESSWALFSALARFVSQTPLTRVREHCSQLLLGSSAKLPSREFVSIVLSSFAR